MTPADDKQDSSKTNKMNTMLYVNYIAVKLGRGETQAYRSTDRRKSVSLPQTLIPLPGGNYCSYFWGTLPWIACTYIPTFFLNIQMAAHYNAAFHPAFSLNNGSWQLFFMGKYIAPSLLMPGRCPQVSRPSQVGSGLLPSQP